MDSSLGDADQIEGDVIEIIPLGEYESQKAKLKASLSWILHKAYISDIPSEFNMPFYETPEGTLHVKPRLANLLVTSELYCLACTNMFGDSHSQWQGHWRIIQALSRKGIYVSEDDKHAVTETVLMKTAPFQLNAHLALIDALMMAYCSEIMSVENVVKAVRRFAAFNASSELPSNMDDTLMFWINKVCATVQHRILKSSQLIEGETQQKVRIVSRNTPRDNLDIPVIDDIIKDIGDGCSLAVLVHFYCSHILKIDDICLKSNIGIADSLHNLRLVRSFCNKYIPVKCFHLSYEDLLYTHNDLKQNIYVMISELFYWFELKKADCVIEAQSKEEESSVELSALPPRSSSHTGIPQVPISNATKRSFHKQIMDDQRLSQTSHFIPPRQPLLHKRQQQSVDTPETESGSQKHKKNPRRAQSLTSPQEREIIKQSVLAWEDTNKLHMRSQEHLMAADQENYNTSQNLLANVSIDSQLEDSFSDDRIEGLDLSGPSDSTPSPTPTGMTDPRSQKTLITLGHPDYLELESVTSGVNTSRTYVCNDEPAQVEVKPEDFLPKMEPLLPARLKTSKEKINNHSKEEERGDNTPERRKMRSPPKTKSSLSSSQITDISDESGSMSDIITPLPDDQLSARDAISSPRQYSKGYVGFVMVGDPSKDVASVRSHSGSEKSVDTDKEIKASYTVTDHAYTSESARAAGIPVVDSTEMLAHQRRGSREGSVASSRSSGDFSDHESQKIHKDHKTRESENLKTLFSQNKDLFTVPKPVPKIIQKSPSKSQPLTTNFAEIKRLKQTIGKVDNSGYVYMQHGQEASNKDQRKSSMKEKSEKNKPEKKTSFAALPNQTTWQQTSSQKQAESGRMENGDDKSASGTEMSQIRLKLEEKRKLIERKKQTMELQQQKMRQRLGKTAFLHVVSKTKDDEASATGMDGIAEQVNESQDMSTGGDIERPNSLQTDMMSNNLTSTPQRAFSREGIQQTIENVRKKWFQEEPGSSNDQQGEQRYHIEQTMSNVENLRDKTPAVREEQTSYIRESARDKTPALRDPVTSQPEFTKPQQIPQNRQQREATPQREVTQKSVKTENIPRAQSPKQKIQESARQASQDQKENESDYNTSLDKLNQSLTDLQGEIMKLSLQKENLKMADTPKKDSISDSKEQMTAMQTPSGRSRVMGDMQVPTPERIVLGMGDQYSSPTMPPPQPFIPQQPVVIQGQPGPILTCQNQYIPVSPATVQYPGYAPGHPIPPTYAHQPPYPPQNLPHGYTQSPPYPHHVIPPQLSPITSSPYAATMPYQPYSPATNTYTVPSSHSHHPVSMATGHSGAQIYHPTSVHQPYSEMVSRVPQNEPVSLTTQPSDINERTQQIPSDIDDSKIQNGFFVSFGDGTSNKKVKPNLSSSEARSDNSHARAKSQQQPESNSVVSNDTINYDDTSSKMDSTSMLEQTTDVSNLSNAEDQSVSQNTSGIGFVIGDEPSAEDEMYRKKEKFEQLQMKRREEQERKRQYKEIEMQRRKEREMIKKEEEERRKADEKARRELIFKQYQEKKRAAEDDVPRRKEKPSKPRPKSMFIKAKDGMMSDEGSMENLSSHAFTTEHTDTRREIVRDPHKKRCRSCSYSKAGGSRVSSRLAPSRGKMRKAVSCNTLHDDNKSLMHGGMTHRRPPSPDLYRLKKGKSSTDSSSETGSNNAGSDYAGPKLFVKPSSKSNRHIIINAISHCCLAGCVNTDVKNKVLEEIAKSDGKHFIILFRDAGCQYRSLYQYNPETEDVMKIIGVGPKTLTNKMIEKYYKYNSGAKSFSEVTSTKHLSVSIDAVVLHNSVWKTGKPPIAKH